MCCVQFDYVEHCWAGVCVLLQCVYTEDCCAGVCIMLQCTYTEDCCAGVCIHRVYFHILKIKQCTVDKHWIRLHRQNFTMPAGDKTKLPLLKPTLSNGNLATVTLTNLQQKKTITPKVTIPVTMNIIDLSSRTNHPAVLNINSNQKVKRNWNFLYFTRKNLLQSVNMFWGKILKPLKILFWVFALFMISVVF